MSQELIERLKLEAQIHAQEARTANATIAEIYQLCSGGKGEPGNWHGAEPVRALVAERDALAATLRQPAARVDEVCEGCGGHGEVGGLTPQGYDSQECPFCHGTGKEAALSAKPAPERQGSGSLPDTLVPVQREWYALCERAPHAERIRISGALAEAIVKTVVAHPAAPVGVPDGIAQAAAFIQKKADDYAAENCGMEHDTGATTYHYGQAGEDYHHTLIELAEEVAALAAAPSAPQGTQQGEGE